MLDNNSIDNDRISFKELFQLERHILLVLLELLTIIKYLSYLARYFIYIYIYCIYKKRLL